MKEWTHEFTTILGWKVKFKSINDDGISKMCVGSRINWCRPKRDVTVSIIFPSWVIVYKGYYFFCFTLRSPLTKSVKLKGLLSASLCKFISRFFEKNQIHFGFDKVTLSMNFHDFKCHAFLQKADIDDSKW